jgi:hypothetical protein
LAGALSLGSSVPEEFGTACSVGEGAARLPGVQILLIAATVNKPVALIRARRVRWLLLMGYLLI